MGSTLHPLTVQAGITVSKGNSIVLEQIPEHGLATQLHHLPSVNAASAFLLKPHREQFAVSKALYIMTSFRWVITCYTEAATWKVHGHEIIPDVASILGFSRLIVRYVIGGSFLWG